MHAIRFEKVSKRFILQHSRERSLEDLVLGALRRRVTAPRASSREEFWALRNVSFEIHEGEAVGLVGPNGAGKSTLLKLVARIIEPTRGRIVAQGRVGALLEVVAGFHEDLTGKENVFLSGALMGLSRRDIAVRFDEVVSFAEMEKFIDTPVKHYSTGMYMRLGFAVAATLEPEILLIDESLAVGDAAFQRKCLARIAEIKKKGATILFVSHQAEQVERLCSRAVLLWEGQVHGDGAPAAMQKEYESLRQKRLAQRMQEGRVIETDVYAAQYLQAQAPREMHPGAATILAVTVQNTSPVTWGRLDSGAQHTIALSYHWLDRWGQVVIWDGVRTQLPRDLEAGETVTLEAQVVAPEEPGAYRLEVDLVDEGIAWFSQHGVAPPEQMVEVRDTARRRSNGGEMSGRNEMAAPGALK